MAQSGYIPSASGGTSSDFSDTFPTTGTAAGFKSSTGDMVPVELTMAGEVPVSASFSGGSVDIPDGDDVTQGAIADAAVTGDNSGTVKAALRGFGKIWADVWDSTNHWLKVSIQNATLAVTQSGTWTVQPGNTANTTAWKVDGSAVTQPVSGTVAIGSTVTPGTGATNLGKAEDAAHSSGDVGVMALAVSNENQTAFGAASGDYAPISVNRYGQSYVTAPPPSHASSNGTPITATTTSVIAAPSAGNHLRVSRFLLSNGGSTATWVAIRDGASGTRYYNAYLVQGSMVGFNLMSSGPLDLTTATRLDIVLSAAGSVEYQIDYYTVAD